MSSMIKTGWLGTNKLNEGNGGIYLVKRKLNEDDVKYSNLVKKIRNAE